MGTCLFLRSEHVVSCNTNNTTNMGWTFTPRYTKADLVRERTDRTVKRFTSTDGAAMEWEVLDHSLRGNHLWKVVRYKKNDKEELFIALDLLAYRKGDGAGYKDMGESSGPYYYDCPLKFLEMVPETPRSEQQIEWDNKQHGGLSWRDRVRAFHAGKLKKAKIQYKEGQRWELKEGLTATRSGAKLHTVKITSVRRSSIYGVCNDGREYRIVKKWLVRELMGEKEVTFTEMNEQLGGALTS